VTTTNRKRSSSPRTAAERALVGTLSASSYIAPMMLSRGEKIEFVFDDAHRRIHVEARGPFELADAIAVVEQQAIGGAWQYGAVIDVRVGLLPPEDQSALLQCIEHLALKHGPRGPVALIAADLGVAQTYAWRSAHIGQRVKVFRDAFQAERWLDRQILWPGITHPSAGD
jgi:hypothetical protein